jgi:uncharacterized delta-60 repeat protein
MPWPCSQTAAVEPPYRRCGGRLVRLKSISPARYHLDGSLDTSFEGDGKVITDFNNLARAYALALQPDGKLVVAGEYFNSDTTDFALVRYNPNGSLDASFGYNGKAFTDFLGWDTAYALALQPDGKIVAAGRATDSFALVRYTAAGSDFFTYSPNGQFEYLAAGEVATDTFTYVVSDGALTDTATVSITVTGVDDPPLAEGFYERMDRSRTNEYRHSFIRCYHSWMAYLAAYRERVWLE